MEKPFPTKSLEEVRLSLLELSCNDKELKTRTITALDAACAGRDAIRTTLQKCKGQIEKNIKHDGTPVTNVDIASSHAILQTIQKSFPQDRVICEEAPITQESTTYEWVIDPIDGTGAFIDGAEKAMAKKKDAYRGDFGIHIGVLKHKEPIIGFNYYPAFDTVYGGIPTFFKAFKATATSFECFEPKPVITVLNNYSIAAPNETMKEWLEYLKHHKVIGDQSTTVGSVGLRLVLVAEGAPYYVLMDDKWCESRCGTYDFVSTAAIFEALKLSDPDKCPVFTDCHGGKLDFRHLKLHKGILATPHQKITDSFTKVTNATNKTS